MTSALAGIRALTLDLDDTLWPVWPAIERAEARLYDWLCEFAPRTAAAFPGPAALRAIREQVGREHPEKNHDLTWLRQESIRQALMSCGESPNLAVPAMDLFMRCRQQVELFPDVLPALERLAPRWPLLALTNGNADLQAIGLAHFFQGCLSARAFGTGKPEVRFFHAACQSLGFPAEQVLHVGDDWNLDVQGALTSGMPAVWVHRSLSKNSQSDITPDQRLLVIEDLSTLPELLASYTDCAD